jgi:monoamine oxidase
MSEVVIIGAGLSGLTAAYALSKSGISTLILEGRDRFGGRIHSLDGPIEMGATWFGQQHVTLIKLLEEIGITSFEQHTKGKISFDPGQKATLQYFDYPQGQAPSFRIKEGTSTLLQHLKSKATASSIKYNLNVTGLHLIDDTIQILTEEGEVFTSSIVINTIPSQLFASTINIEPNIDKERRELMSQTHTWMGESIKFAFGYTVPFWKEKGLSGMGFSQSGVIQEVHDHSNFENNFFALKGFLNPDLVNLNQEDRKKLVIDSMVKLFGEEAKSFISYHESVWLNEKFTSNGESPYLAPHQNNGHSLLAKPLLNGRLIMAGSETSSSFPGYMDGAVNSGLRAANEVIQMVNSGK